MSRNHLVLFEPEIPQNTGNCMRTCVGTNTTLHLIKPLGFNFDDVKVKRSAVNYFKHLKYFIYENFEDFMNKNPNGKKYYLSRYGLKSPHELVLDKEDEDYYFIIGKESTGIPKEILKEHLDECIRLPMTDKIRALNMSNVAAIVIYEALRQQDYQGLERYEPEIYKGKNYLLNKYPNNHYTP